MPEQVIVFVDTELLQQIRKLRDEQIHRPGFFRLLLEVSGLSATELVVQDDGNGLGGPEPCNGNEDSDAESQVLHEAGRVGGH